MTFVETLARNTLKGGLQMLRLTGVSQEQLRKTEGALVPIVPLSAEHLPSILQHLKDLSEHDRHLRFGYTATDEHINRYVQSLNFERDEIYGIFNTDLEIIAMAHLALIKQDGHASSSEFGVSESSHARGRG